MGKHLDFYYKCMKSGILPDTDAGLCGSAKHRRISSSLFKLFQPSFEEDKELSALGMSTAYWASGLPANHWKRFIHFTELRQTIVLFMAAMNNEL